MRGLLALGVGAFAAGAAVAVVQQRRNRMDDDFGEDPNWPAVPYTHETHPDSPQQAETAPVEEAPSQAARASAGSPDDATTEHPSDDHEQQ